MTAVSYNQLASSKGAQAILKGLHGRLSVHAPMTLTDDMSSSAESLQTRCIQECIDVEHALYTLVSMTREDGSLSWFLLPEIHVSLG